MAAETGSPTRRLLEKFGLWTKLSQVRSFGLQLQKKKKKNACELSDPLQPPQDIGHRLAGPGSQSFG